MCEIAVVDPEQCDVTIIQQIAAKFNEEQGDGLGILAVKESPDGFEYDMYKSVYPHWQTMYAFLKRNLDDTWRFIIHGRASTSGKINREAAHPIRVDCDQCEFDYVVHNGSVRNYKHIRSGLVRQEHDFNTEVDSEILAHKVQELPDTVEDHNSSTYTFRGNLNYLLFSEDGIFTRVSSKYHITDDFTMTCSLTAFDEPEEYGFARGNDTEWVLITPGDDGPEMETKERVYSGNSSTRSNYGYGGYGNSSRSRSRSSAGSSGSEQATYTKEYVDHCPEFDHITAIKLADGIIEVIDSAVDESTLIYRDADPRLYYWYAPEEPKVDVGYLEDLAKEAPYKPGQTSLEDFAEEKVESEAFTEPTARAIAEADDEVSLEEAAQIADDVYDQIMTNEQAIHGTIGE